MDISALPHALAPPSRPPQGPQAPASASRGALAPPVRAAACAPPFLPSATSAASRATRAANVGWGRCWGARNVQVEADRSAGNGTGRWRRGPGPLVCSASQRAWVYREYGGRDTLHLEDDVPLPTLAPDQVLIRVAAAGLNPVDYKRRQGKFKSTDSPLPTVPGYDVAGSVVEVGSAVSLFRPGDAVYSNISEAALNQPKQYGSLAQFTATEEELVAPKPASLDFIQAAAVPLAALTAQEALERAGFKAGQSALILNGAGGVGTFAIQLAKKVYGAALVASTASRAKAALVRDLGADVVIEYDTQDYSLLPQRYDFVLDAIGDGARAVSVLAPGGRALVLTGPVPEGSRAERFVVTSSGAKLRQVTDAIDSGLVSPVLDPRGPFAFSDVHSAFEHLESGHATGKVVVGPVE